MDAILLIKSLRRQVAPLGLLLEDVDGEQARWRPEPGRWSILEVAGHLLDEEREDFRARLAFTLRDPELDWPPIDPQGWVESRRYAERDLGQVFQAWREERERSLAWLEGLRNPDWERAHRHPAGFVLRAGDLLAAWAAHDLLHLRQLARLHLLWLQEKARPYSPEYAGPIN
jgi:hypothetical protein